MMATVALSTVVIILALSENGAIKTTITTNNRYFRQITDSQPKVCNYSYFYHTLASTVTANRLSVIHFPHKRFCKKTCSAVGQWFVAGNLNSRRLFYAPFDCQM